MTRGPTAFPIASSSGDIGEKLDFMSLIA